MSVALRALGEWWKTTPGSLPCLEAWMAAHNAELGASPETLGMAWIAWELAQPEGREKQRLETKLREWSMGQGFYFPGAEPAHIEALLQRRRMAPLQPHLIPQLAPKFYSPGDPRPFSRKLELQKLQRTKKRWEKKIGKELLAAGREEHRASAVRSDQRRREGQRTVNRLANELQQQKKIIERENTSGLPGETRRVARKRRR